MVLILRMVRVITVMVKKIALRTKLRKVADP